VFRDYDRADATFKVTLHIDASGPECDPANEPWRDYIGTGYQCETIRYTCPSGTKSFSNSCGCGCEN
jgi:hypothetical protein